MSFGLPVGQVSGLLRHQLQLIHHRLHRRTVVLDGKYAGHSCPAWQASGCPSACPSDKCPAYSATSSN